MWLFGEPWQHFRLLRPWWLDRQTETRSLISKAHFLICKMGLIVTLIVIRVLFSGLMMQGEHKANVRHTLALLADVCLGVTHTTATETDFFVCQWDFIASFCQIGHVLQIFSRPWKDHKKGGQRRQREKRDPPEWLLLLPLLDPSTTQATFRDRERALPRPSVKQA